MNLRVLLKAALFSAILFTSTTAIAQSQLTPEPEPTPTPANVNVDVVYTGRLFGYFRVPSLQKFGDIKGCPEEGQQPFSHAADQFREVRDKQVKTKTVLVGTGDNFSPQLEARVFSEPPADGNNYAIGNKELYLGSKERWVFYKEKSGFSDNLRDRIAEGHGTIPTDNVACFLRRMGFAAIVPGKHDFYFGAERVRHFARFLAEPDSGKYERVQMLAANLVMKTEPIDGASAVSAKVKAERSFVDWPSAYPVMNLKDGKSVYPWFSLVKIQLGEIPPEAKALLEDFEKKVGANRTILTNDLTTLIDKNVKALEPLPKSATDLDSLKLNRLKELKANLQAISRGRIRVCPSDGSPNELRLEQKECDETQDQLRLIGNKIVLHAYLKPKFRGEHHFSTLEYGKNFGLCTVITKDDGASQHACMRFSSHIPFFYFPHRVPNENGVSDGYFDPEPYTVKNNVAIFGVVDPTLGEQVGILNFGWKQKGQSELTTRLSVEDPADALQQQFDYFEIQQPNFPGIKVLLAQMTPQRARALATRFPEFQVVVAAADRTLATSNIAMSTTWKPQTAASGAFLAVPTPYFSSAERQGSVHLGIINATKQTEEWKLSAQAIDGKLVSEPEDRAEKFWRTIKSLPGCLQIRL